MKDIGLFPLRAGTPAPATGPRGAEGGERGFDRALERSRGAQAAPQRPADSAGQMAQQRLDEARLAQARSAQPAAAAQADARAGTHRAAEPARRNDSDTRNEGPERAAAPAERTDPMNAAARPAQDADADADRGPAAGHAATAAEPEAAFADQTAALVAASAALTAPPPAAVAVAAGATDAAADTDTAADATADTAADADAAPVLAATAGKTAALIDAAPGANRGQAAGAQPAPAAAAADGSARTLPALTADLTRSAAKDRLMEDFERRFETSLARAVGGNGQGPLATAGLPPLAAPPPPPPHAAGTPQAAVASPIGHPSFADDLSYRVLMFAGQRLQSAELTVTPAELGPVKVAIEVRGQEAALQFSAAHATTRAALEDALPRLREMLAAQGLQLTQANVGDAPHRGSGNGGDAAQRGSGRAAANAPAEASARVAAPAGVAGPGLTRIGLIDIHV